MPKYTFRLEVEPPFSRTTTPGPWFEAEGPDLPGKVHIRLGKASNDQYVCTGLVVDAIDSLITTSGLRGIPVNEMIDDLLRQSGDPKNLVYSLMETVDLSKTGGFSIQNAITPATPSARPQRGGRGPDETELTRFAAIYKAMLNDPDERHRPIAATAKAMDISTGSAHRWRARAIAKGLLEM
ncbi:MAG: hypothetical protein JWP75_4152 [Frondihabitans sp.]|nr:hypothetical protein [Frondihabitans sp.]